MNQIFTYNPISKEGHWLCKLKLVDGKTLVGVGLHKIGRHFEWSRLGIVSSMLSLHGWYADIRKLEHYFDREIERLGRLVRRKSQAKIKYKPYSDQVFDLRVNNPIQFSLYRLIRKFDKLACLQESGLRLSIFKKRRVFEGKLSVYKKCILCVLNGIYQHVVDRSEKDALSLDEKERLILAMHAEVMPILNQDVLNTLKKLTRNEHI